MTVLPRNRFYYLRHGQTDWNLRGVAQGSQDIPLNERGREQAREAAESAIGLEIAEIISSPLCRAFETASIVGGAVGLDPGIDPSLKEVCWGEMEGTGEKDWMDDWQSGRFKIPGAETFEQFVQRSAAAVTRILDEPGPTLIVAHGGVYWGVQRALGLDVVDIPNGMILEHIPCDTSPNGWRIVIH